MSAARSSADDGFVDHEAERADVALIFPPLTEARLFPYLSLPMLSAWLRARGRRVVQADFNIELCHELFQRQYLLERLDVLTSRPPSLAIINRVEMMRYVLDHLDCIRSAVFDKNPDDPEVSQHDIRFCRQTVELLLEESLLAKQVTDFGEIASIVGSFKVPDPLDFATSIMKRRTESLLGEHRPRVLGISIAFWSQILPAVLMARWARTVDPSVVIIFGGQQIMLWHQQMRDAVAPSVDGLCIGGGEECLEALCEAVNGTCDHMNVPNLIWLKSPIENPIPHKEVPLNELPAPDFDGLPIRSYLSEEIHLAMITCIGCYWGKCTFCSYGARNPPGGGYQQMNPRHIADTCEALIERYAIRRINFVDENTPLLNVIRAMRLLNDRGQKIRFSTRNRLDGVLLNSSICNELADRGCVLMSAGYETNSQRLLDRLRKGVNASQYATIFSNLYAAGIPLRLSIMGGILDETEEERAESEAFLKEHSDKIGIDVMQMLVIEPGTELWRDPELYDLQVSPGNELRGNAMLSYGLGRMGAKFTWTIGDGFERRLERFLGIFENVDPQMNDELPPHRRRGKQNLNVMALGTVKLLPWVRVIRMLDPLGSPTSIIIDLMWQRFFEVPSDWNLLETELSWEVRPTSPNAVRQLLKAGLIEQVIPRALG